MKKILLTTLTAFAAFTTQAQLQLGILADYHYSYLYNKSDVAADVSLDYVQTFKPSFGLHVGYSFHPKVTLVAEPQYYKAGQQFKGVFTNAIQVIYTSNINLGYIKLPLYLQYQFANNAKGVSQYLQFGGYIAGLQHFVHDRTEDVYLNGYARPDITYKLAYKSDNQLSVTKIVPKGTGDSSYVTLYNADKPKFNKFDYGLHVGYGIKFPLKQNLSISTDIYARYGFAAVDNIDTITIVSSEGNLTYQSTLTQITH